MVAMYLDHLGADRFSALGDAPVLLVPAAGGAPVLPVQAVVIGLDEAGILPPVDPERFDLLLTSATVAPAPWVRVPPDRFASHTAMLADRVRRWPRAATMLAQVLRIGEKLTFAHAVQVESLAYSALLGGEEFRRWLAARASALPAHEKGFPVHVDRHGDAVTVTLASPATRNAMTAAMRDALHEALCNGLDDPSNPSLLLHADGPCFSTGGDLSEFGSAADLAQAHIVRTLRSCAVALHDLGTRAAVEMHGACIGSGLEVPAAAAHRRARADAWFQLPELAMGLIPGAGGTASVGRAIGRHRTCWMVLSGRRIGAEQALDWGLIHGISA
jgi:hypothetical protein